MAPICSTAVSMEMHREASVQFPVLNPMLTLSTSVRLSGTWQLPVSGSKRACVDLVRIASVRARAFTCMPQHSAKFIKFALLSPIRKCVLPPVER